MRRPGGERKLKTMRGQEHPKEEGLMVRGVGYQPPGAATAAEPEAEPDDGKTTADTAKAERERQRIQATMASMRNEVLGMGKESSKSVLAKPPSVTDSFGMIQQVAASRSARMRASRESRLMAAIQPTSETNYEGRITTGGDDLPPRPSRSTDSAITSGANAPSEQGLFTRVDPRQAAPKPAESGTFPATESGTYPTTESALGFEKWTVRPSSLMGPDGEQEMPAAAAPSYVDEKQQEFCDLEITDDDALGGMMDDFGSKRGGDSIGGRAPVKGTPINEQEGCNLKQLMFGSPAVSFSQEWTMQNFAFNKTENITYGIVQHKGGPCGVVAVVQAYVMKALLYGSRLAALPPVGQPRQPSAAEQRAALSAAIAEILWKCGHGAATVALSSGRAQFPGGGRYKSDGVTETLQLQPFAEPQPLLEYVREQLPLFLSPQGAGCILLTYSAVLSRGLRNVVQDMDVPTNTVIGQHGYCTQELVNLLLTGEAASNVFNDTVKLGEGNDVTILKGVNAKSEIGLLSLFEHYKSCEVGTNLKSPHFPIWVILSESHFTCLFAPDPQLCKEQPAGGKFDIFYYDMLARQDDEIRLTVDYGGDSHADPPAVGSGELVPPLEHCIRTRWAGATVNWNGYEAIL